ncbi:MAG TPA: hypothetical protein VFB02_11960 [Bradyrhizobium sp.]|nr:hypothetical protein [Bradyrhizobium sp.]
MNASSRTTLVLSLASLLAVTSVSAQERPVGQPPGGHPAPQGRPARPVGAAPQARVGADARFAHGPIVAHDFGGHAYRGRLAWEGGRWRHEMHDGRMGWWWDVGGVWYFYPERMDGPPAYISEDFADDVNYADGPPPGAYPPPPVAAYAPPPPPPPPDPAASAVGGAVVGGLLGGLLTGRASGAAAGAVIGGATGAIAGATAASRPGYYLAQGTCYYRYPSGQYVEADPRWCY